MKRKIGMLLAGVAGVVLCVSVASAATIKSASSDSPPQVEILEVSIDESDLGGTNIPDYRCKECGAHHGGCYYPYCPDCHSKLCPPAPIKPLNPPPK